jgi:hypothetical protein
MSSGSTIRAGSGTTMRAPAPRDFRVANLELAN